MEFFFISQNRAELGSDPEMMEAFWNAGMRMLYLGVESSSAENLKLIEDFFRKHLVSAK